MPIIPNNHHLTKKVNNKTKYKQQQQFKININKFLQPTQHIAKLITQFFQPKKHDYNQNVLNFYSTTYNFVHQKIDILNKHNEKLYSSLFYKTSKKNIMPKNCIIYCHGFGSTRLQASHILKVLGQNISLCCFDFSGSGKSQGDIITYGAKQKDDIQSVIDYLKSQMSVENFILWGRSMGATACLLYSLKNYCHEKTSSNQKKLEDNHYRTQSDENLKVNIVFQIIDSPFVSFQKIAIQMAKKFVSIPQFGTSLALGLMRQKCEILGEFNPFNVSLQSIQSCKVPTLFIYSQQDEIVSSKNSQYLTKKYTGFFQKIIINQSHNAPRLTETLAQIMKKISIQLKKCQINRKNGVMFRSFMSSQEMKENRSNKKGIQRSLKKEDRADIFSRESQNKQDLPRLKSCNSDYGIKTISKCQTPNPHQIYLNHIMRQTSNIRPISSSVNQHIRAQTPNPYKFSIDNQKQQYLYRQKVLSYSTLPHNYEFKEYESPFGNSSTKNKTHKQNDKMKMSHQKSFKNILASENTKKQFFLKEFKAEMNNNECHQRKKSQKILQFSEKNKKIFPKKTTNKIKIINNNKSINDNTCKRNISNTLNASINDQFKTNKNNKATFNSDKFKFINNQIEKQKLQEHQNIYQMHQPQINIINKFSKFNYENRQSQNLEDSLNSNKKTNKYRQDHRRSSSGNKKLTLSLSMMKIFKNNQNQQSKNNQINQFKNNKNQQLKNNQTKETTIFNEHNLHSNKSILKMDPKKLVFRPTSEYQTHNQSNQFTSDIKLSKNTKLNSSQINPSQLNSTQNTQLFSSSMDNMRLMKFYKTTLQYPVNHQTPKQNKYISDHYQIVMTPKRCVKKMRSSQVVYYDRALYRYGI